MNEVRWDANQIPELRGKVALVTGANSGLGWHIALQLATHGAHVIMACRDNTKAIQAANAIRSSVPDARISQVPLDLSSLASVRACAKRVINDQSRLDLLINNAGVMFLPYERTDDGFDIHMASNHLGHFLLTGLLLERLERTDGARVVTTSSGFARFGRLPTDNLHGNERTSSFHAYSNSKLANLAFSCELARRLEKGGSRVISLAAHPGYAATNLQFGAANKMRSPIKAGVRRLAMRVSNAVLAQHARMGALSALYAATASRAANGEYIGPDGWMEQRGYPTRARIPEKASDGRRAAEFWALSERSADVRY
ncbi:hypothetical protein BWP39_02930 [Paraburkholderia acidicola]|uniref:NAD(P)-dependent dehydrogenase (Short-subunit alcohol dehydrogenase family) n=1 Tax=Paraburkholderia acidicola TaxID=1912599 RepID=A0A2A4F273_9BURK|nr:oxidoreductase [Paraburkholderia acidicola]PCE27471.1 hypothetical protein BWP39_02930 [Paraburkholderia acidicola]